MQTRSPRTLTDRTCVLVLGIGDVASAVAHRLFSDGYIVALHNDRNPPKTHRRKMAFADAFFDGASILDGVTARRCERAEDLMRILAEHSLPVLVSDFQSGLAVAHWDVVIDARMQKRTKPTPQRGVASLTIGLGPGHVAGETVDIAIETSWGDQLGAVVLQGPTLPLEGEPRAIEGVGRQRNVYTPIDGVLRSDCSIGDSVSADAAVATIDTIAIRAPISGTLRGLVRPGVAVLPGDKIVEVDPRPPDRANFCGLGERPQRIAAGVSLAIRE